MIRNFDDIMGNIDPFDYEIKENIDSGPGSMFYRATEKKSEKEFAICFSVHEKNELNRYINTLVRIKEIDLPGVVKLYGYKIYIDECDHLKYFKEDIFYGNNENYFYLIRILDLMKNGNIKKLLTKNHQQKEQFNKIINPTNINKFIFGVCSTMKSLHDIQFIHRNLKPTKIFLDENYEPRIMLDVESVFLNGKNYLNESHKLYSGVRVRYFVPYLNSIFNAPEILEEYDYSYPVDVYSFAIVLYSIFSSKTPKKRIKGQKVQLIQPLNISDDIWKLIKSCSSEDPNQRPSFEEIVMRLKEERINFDKNDFNLIEFLEYQNRIELFRL